MKSELNMKAMKNVAIVGWYHKLNYGDDLLQHSFCHLLSNCKLSFIDLDADPSVLLSFDYVIFGGGSIWPNHTLLSDPILSGKIRYSIIGVSVRELTSSHVSSIIINNADLVVVRDHHSAKLLNNPKVQCMPDLTWFKPLPLKDSISGANKSVSVNLRNWSRLDWNSKEIVSRIKSRNYDSIYGVSFFEGSPSLEDGSAMSDKKKMAAAGVTDFVDGSYYATLNTSINIGMRFHYLVLSAQMGVPFVGFDYHPKIKAFMQDIGFEEYCVSLTDTNALSDALDHIEDNYIEVCARLRSSRDEIVKQAESFSVMISDEFILKNSSSLSVASNELFLGYLLRFEDRLKRKLNRGKLAK